jgi:ArsR family transcriptional regulator
MAGNCCGLTGTQFMPQEVSTMADKIALITNEEDIFQASHSLKAMAHPLRLKIMCILGGSGEVSVQDIVEQVGTSQSNISQHLSILREKGILASRKDANKVYYRIADPKILQLIGAMRSAFCSASED